MITLDFILIAVNTANKALQDEEKVKKAKLILEEAAAMLDLKVINFILYCFMSYPLLLPGRQFFFLNPLILYYFHVIL